MAEMASSAPRDWLPIAEKVHNTIPPYRPYLIHFRCTRVVRKYMSGMVMMMASASSLLPSTKLSGGPHTRLAPPPVTVKTPPFRP